MVAGVPGPRVVEEPGERVCPSTRMYRFLASVERAGRTIDSACKTEVL